MNIDNSTIQQILGSVVQRHPDITYVGDQLVVTPVRHFVRSVNLSEIGGPNSLMGTWGVQTLWSLEGDAQIWNFIQPGYRLTPLRHDALLVEKVEPTQPDAYCEELQTVTLPFLRGIESIFDLIKIAKDPKNPCCENAYAHFYLEIASGHFDRALEIFNDRRKQWLHEKGYYWSEQDVSEDMRLRRLGQLLESGSHAQIAEVLRRWEERSARRAGIDHVWEPSPFPFEPGYEEWRKRSGTGGT